MRGAWRRTVALEATTSSRSDLTAELLVERQAEAALEDAEVSGNKAAVRRARRRLGAVQERHDAQRSR